MKSSLSRNSKSITSKRRRIVRQHARPSGSVRGKMMRWMNWSGMVGHSQRPNASLRRSTLMIRNNLTLRRKERLQRKIRSVSDVNQHRLSLTRENPNLSPNIHIRRLRNPMKTVRMRWNRKKNNRYTSHQKSRKSNPSMKNQSIYLL